MTWEETYNYYFDPLGSLGVDDSRSGRRKLVSLLGDLLDSCLELERQTYIVQSEAGLCSQISQQPLLRRSEQSSSSLGNS